MEQQTGGRQPQGGLGQVVEFVPRSAEFVKESWQELKKVHWPTRKETYSATVIVIVAVVVVAAFLGLVDFALSYAMQCVMGSAGARRSPPPAPRRLAGTSSTPTRDTRPR